MPKTPFNIDAAFRKIEATDDRPPIKVTIREESPRALWIRRAALLVIASSALAVLAVHYLRMV